MMSKVVLKSSLQGFLRQERHNLSQSPILLVSSLAESSKVAEKTIDASLQKFKFYAQQALGLPLFATQITSAVCTDLDIANVEKLKHRTGASVVIGLGSGAAIDLAKATAGNNDALYLLPLTSAALLASHTSMSLVLDTKEETIFTKANHQEGLIVLQDDDLVVHPHTLPACRAILLDAALRNSTVDLSKAMNTTLLETLQYTALQISTGLGDQPRSIPLCLASSLIPPIFSSCHIFTFWASLVPALHARLPGAMSLEGEKQLPALASLALEAKSIDSLLQHIRDNQFVSRAHDVPEHVITEVLATSLNR